MDIHRCRFVPYPPSTINALAFSYTQGSKEKKPADLRLAVGRANGNIEIWNPLGGAWLQETIIRGGKDRSVDGLVWIQDPDEQDGAGRTITGRLRLFSIGYTTTVTEWDLEKGQPLRQSSGNHGEIWCIAAQPLKLAEDTHRSGNVSSDQWPGQDLVTGCTDGAVVLYSTVDEDLKLKRVLVRPSSKKAKVISINFQDRNTVVAGCTDSTIRIYDVRSGVLVRSMSLGAGPTGAPREIIVWAVKCLPSGNIVSGDSTGELRVWDGKTYTLIQRIKSHKQDILSLAASNDGSMIFSGGMDRRTIVYKQTGGPKSKRWGEVAHRRFHNHDVKTMASFEGMGMSVIASGGPDGSPIVLPLREFGLENQRMLPYLPQEPVVQSATKKRLLMSWWDREIYIWHINEMSEIPDETPAFESEAEIQKKYRKLAAKVIVKGEANISSASISSDGTLLAVSTSAAIKLFHLHSQKSTDSYALKVKKLQLPSIFSARGAKLLQFSPNGRWLGIVGPDNRVVAARIVGDGRGSFTMQPMPSVLARLKRETGKLRRSGGLGAYDRSVTRMAFSSDSSLLAVSDLAGFIDTWVIDGEENPTVDASNDRAAYDTSLPSSSDRSDTEDKEEKKSNSVLGQRWIRSPSASLLPRLLSPAVVLSFRPTTTTAVPEVSLHSTRNNSYPRRHDSFPGESRLLIVTATGGVMEFDILHGALSSWSRRNPTSSFPTEFNRLRDRPMGCIWDIGRSEERLWLYGSNWLWMFDLSRDFQVNEPTHKTLTNGHVNGGASNINQARPSKRRKMSNGGQDVAAEQKRAISGAGSCVPDHELGTGMSRRHQIVIHDEDGSIRDRIKDHLRRPHDIGLDHSEQEMDEDGTDLALGRLRRSDDAAPENDEQLAKRADAGIDVLPWWHTYKYRPILGVVPIYDGTEGLEVALVERPTWELSLPPRYIGDWDWERPEL